MKQLFYSFALVAFIMLMISCNKDDHNSGYAQQNIELRAAELGFPDVKSYKESVSEQCAAGNHENCDILNDGTHQAGAYSDHSGTKPDGTHHNGTSHGTHDANGHSHGSHGDGNHH